MEHAQSEQPQPEKMPSLYYEDDFPMEDCVVTLIKRDGLWGLRVYAPEKYGEKSPLESYRGQSLAECFYQLEIGRKIYAARKKAVKLRNPGATFTSLKVVA